MLIERYNGDQRAWNHGTREAMMLCAEGRWHTAGESRDANEAAAADASYSTILSACASYSLNFVNLFYKYLLNYARCRFIVAHLVAPVETAKS